MISAMEFATKSIELAQLDKQMQDLRKDLDEYILANGPQSVGPVEYKITTPSRKFDYVKTWNLYGADTGIDIQEYLVTPDPIPTPEPYIDYRAAVKAAKIKNIVVTNQSDINNNREVKVIISHG